MINTISWTLISIPTGYVLSDLINYYHYRLYNTSFSFKNNVVICATLLGFLRGYTGNDLVTNIQNGFDFS
jgi:hypothetical protein